MALPATQRLSWLTLHGCLFWHLSWGSQTLHLMQSALPTAERGHRRAVACLLSGKVSGRPCTQAWDHLLSVASHPCTSAQLSSLVLQAQVQARQGQQALLQEQLSAAEASVQEAMAARQLQTERIKASKAAQKAGQ